MEFTERRILVVSLDFPYPPNHGGRLDIWGRIRALHRLGFTVDLVATANEPPQNADVEAVKPYVREVVCLKRPRKPIHNCSLLPFQVQSRRDLRTIAFRSDYDVTLLETEYVLHVLNNPTLRTQNVVLRVQNDESAYFKELSLSEGSRWKKLYFVMESYKFRLMEKAVRKRIANLLFISHDEYSRFRSRYPHIHSVFLPAPLTSSAHEASCSDSRTALFIGSLFMPNNREALRWYISAVHPHLSGVEGYQLIVAGNTRGESVDWLTELTGKFSNIRVYNSPENLRPLYEGSSVFVNPMLHGAGVKLKSIDAIQNGLPVVSTTVGNQGTGLVHGEHIVVADEPPEFAGALRDFLLDPPRRKIMVSSAQAWLSEHYNHEMILKDCFSSLLCNRRPK